MQIGHHIVERHAGLAKGKSLSLGTGRVLLVADPVQRRAEAEKAALEQKNARPDEEEAVEVRLSKDEQMQQRRANQRMGAEVMSQRIREMSDNDPRVVALVIRGWMGNEHE